ncbi:MAG: SiaB family protein kinase [Crocinitomicaceae bacterium]|nr:SiaB family protein kinase [Crocinitomicaceae bacterium]
MTGVENENISAAIREIFQNQHDSLVNEETRKILVSHYGTFSQDLVSTLSNGVEELLVSIGDKRIIIKRMFSILIEGLQNIRIHGGKDEQGNQLGFLLIAGSTDNYKLVMSNIISKKDRNKVVSYLDRINGLSKDKLRETYLSILSNEFLSQKGGAGLGFITTKMKSSELGYQFNPLNKYTMLFTFEIILARS